MTGRTPLSIGFIPLIDASILITAREEGFAEEEGLSLSLYRESSWANIRDRLAIGHFDAAHMLAPMPIATNLGLTPFDNTIVVPMALGLGGNAVTVSRKVCEAMSCKCPARNAGEAGRALRELAMQRAIAGEPKLRFGVVHPHSAHNLELRYWLAGCGISPDRDVEIVILPPALMSDALLSGSIDGYCVGEPWNTLSLERGHGAILTTKDQIWANSPEKVLGVSSELAARAPETVAALVRACYRAARWCGDPANRGALARLLAQPAYLDLPVRIIERALGGVAAFEPWNKAATFPWKSHALWFYSQMVRWQMVDHSPRHAHLAAEAYAPDLYRAALAGLHVAMPAASAKVEGALRDPQFVGATSGKLLLGPDGFFDGKSFDPDNLDSYIAAQRGI